MNEFVVYWLYDAACVCMWRHGYIGISNNFDRRLTQHRKRFGSNFKHRIIFHGTRVEALALEDKLRPTYGIGWNVNKGGNPAHPITEAIRAKMSIAARNRPPMSEATREKFRITSAGRTNKGRLGQKKSDEERAKISASNKGKKRNLTDEQRQAAAERVRLRKPHLGRRHSDEARAKMSAARRGKPIHSEAHKRKLSRRMKGNTYTKGKPWSVARRLAQIGKSEQQGNKL